MKKIRENYDQINIWPGFVDALSTVLLVFIFILVGFISAQIYLSNIISNKNSHLDNMKKRLAQISKMLNSETENKTKLKEEVLRLTAEISKLEELLNNSQEKLNHAVCDKKSLEDQICALNCKINEITCQLAETNKQNKEKEEKLKQLTQFSTYRSEFFALLQNILKNESGITVSGDRFIFQSELFFESASDELSEDGKKQIKKVAEVIKKISAKIPQNVNWILRVDGHTDKRPISTDKFASNWELSAARAIAVVKALINLGIAPKNLVAAGFGEYQPLKDDDGDISENRRIEFKLDQR